MDLLWILGPGLEYLESFKSLKSDVKSLKLWNSVYSTQKSNWPLDYQGSK